VLFDQNFRGRDCLHEIFVAMKVDSNKAQIKPTTWMLAGDGELPYVKSIGFPTKRAEQEIKYQ
jgi:hypothetical protein